MAQDRRREWEWKGDTSSDEIVGHFFAYPIAYDLLPDEELKRQVAETAKRITDHIIAHGFHLVDIDGQPTTWEFGRQRNSTTTKLGGLNGA